MLKRMAVVLSVAALLLTGTAWAQENATLIMRSGDRISGQLIDMGGVGFTIRVNGVERQIPTNSVAVIDFTGGATNSDWANLQAGQQLVMLRNGQTVDGQLHDISGTTPLKITVRTSSGEREFSSNEIGRIVLARPDTAVATTSQTTATSGTGIAVSARQQWTSTGISVRRGETLTFSTTGEVQLSSDPSDIAGAAGARSQRFAAGAPIPGVYAGALIARIGNGRPFVIGDQTSVRMPDAGQLFLGINDDGFDDNRGEFRADVRRGGTAIRR